MNDHFGFHAAINWDVVDHLTLEEIKEAETMTHYKKLRQHPAKGKEMNHMGIKDGVFAAVCIECGEDALRLVEEGYVRVTSISHWDEEKSLHLYTDGWDDMSQEGDGPMYIYCMECGTVMEHEGLELFWD